MARLQTLIARLMHAIRRTSECLMACCTWRRMPPGTNEKIFAFVVPAKKRQAAIDGCHYNARHQGRDRALSLMKERFWWPGMVVQVMMTVKGCLRCKQFEAKLAITDLVMIESTEPLDLVHIDIVNMETTMVTRKMPVVKKVLVVVDHFMRYVRAYVVPDRTVRTIAKTLYENYFLVFRFPCRLMLDQAPEFVGGVLSVLCDLLQVKKLCTLPYHPQSNGAVEWTHQTLMRMIGKLDPNHKHRWLDHISSIYHAYNTTRSQVTGYSPHFLKFGHQPHLPIDLLFQTAQRAAVKGVDSYVTTLYDHLRLAIGKMRATAEKEARRFKRIYDRQAGAIALHPGDKVLICLDSFVGQRRKLKNR